jgi:hydrogenase small subunit
LGQYTQTGGYVPGNVAALAGGVVAGALLVHGLGMKAAGRIGEGPDTEDMKEHDRKHMKGGDK